MNKKVFFLLLTLFLSSCKNEDAFILGEWNRNNSVKTNEGFSIHFYSKNFFSLTYTYNKLKIQSDGIWKWDKKTNIIELKINDRNKIEKYLISSLTKDSLVLQLITKDSTLNPSSELFLKES